LPTKTATRQKRTEKTPKPDDGSINGSSSKTTSKNSSQLAGTVTDKINLKEAQAEYKETSARID
jgi:hypothetical protein